MALIERITVLSSGYNTDPGNPSAVWPGIKIGKRDLSKINNYFSLEDGLFPQGTTLELPGDSSINLVVGSNGIGKTTVLKALARSISNAQYFSKHGRSKMFGEDEHAIAEGTGGLLKHESFGGSFRYYGDVIERNWSDQKKFNPKKYNPDEKRFHFYLSQSSFFMSDTMRIYQQKDETTIDARLSKHFQRTMTGEFDHTKHSIPEKARRFIANHAKLFNISEREVKERLLYIIEIGDLGFQTDSPANVFGVYDLGSSFPIDNVSLGFFDSELQKNKQSKGEYARKTLEGLLLLKGPRVLLLDEPTSHLGGDNEDWFYENFLPTLNGSQTMAFIATNDRALSRLERATVVDMKTKPVSIRQNP